MLLFLPAQKIVYGKWFITNWRGDNNSNIIDDYSGLSCTDARIDGKLVTTGELDEAGICFELPEETRYLQVNITEISTYREKALKLYLPDSDGFREEKSVSVRMKEGNNVFCLDESISGMVRLDFEGGGPYSFYLNFIQYNAGVQVVAELWGLYILFVAIFVTGIFAYLHREAVSLFLYKHKTDLFVLALFFFLYLVWSLVIPFDRAPDERMRYDIARYIFQYKQLPRGDDPILCMKNEYGISYAFSPYLAYMFSAVFMHYGAIFGITSVGLLHAARFVSIFSSLVTLIFLMKLSGVMKLKNRYMLPCLVGLLPQFAFISCYVNNDAFAIMSVSIIIYAWYTGVMSGWDTKSCMYLSVGMALCVASYYNCYAYLLMSFFIFVIFYAAMYIKKKDISLLKSMVKKGLSMTVFCAIVSGWWFVRNYIIYEGDILGTEHLKAVAIKYAVPERNPLNRLSLREQGVSLKQMLFDMNWIKTSMKSYVAGFDYMTVWLKENIYSLVGCVIVCGLILKILSLFRKKGLSLRRLLFDAAMLFAAVVVVILSLIYSYGRDFQPQGRYLLPTVISLMIYLTEGYMGFFGKYKIVHGLLVFSAVCLNLYCLVCVIVPCYLWV